MTQSSIGTRYLLYLLAAALLIVLPAACGGQDAAPEATIAPVATTAPEPTTAPTELPPTAAPPTKGPPTEAPAAEVTPTVDPTAEAQAAGPDGPIVMTGDCGNAFYPVAEGRSHTYSTNLGALGESTYTTTYSDVSETAFTITTDVGEGEALSVTWTCTGDGMLAPEFTQLPGIGEAITIEFVEAEGVTIPSEDLFRDGGSWTTHYVANVTMPDLGAGPMAMTQTMDMESTVIGPEPVSVAAGDFPDAIRVDTTGSIDIGMTADDTTAPAMGLEIAYSTWYVEGIGMVRQVFSGLLGDGTESVTELVSIQ